MYKVVDAESNETIDENLTYEEASLYVGDASVRITEQGL